MQRLHVHDRLRGLATAETENVGRAAGGERISDAERR
jgi:hypothetical protein